MNIRILKSIAALFSSFHTITHIKRIDDNIFKLQLDTQIFYIDATKSNAKIFCTSNALIESSYNAPFDKSLANLNRAKILSCHTDGDNRILIFHCTQNLTYKTKEFFLHFELTGKHTNVIITDSNAIILEALRHLNSDKTSRIIKINQPLTPLPQPKEVKNSTSLFPIDKSHFTEQDKSLLLAFLTKTYEDVLLKKLERERQNILTSLHKAQKKLQDILDSLPKEEYLLEQRNILNEHAKILLSHIHQIKPYASQVNLKDFNNKEITILIPKPYALPQDAINAMFKESKKLAKKADGIHLERENLNTKISFLSKQIQLITHTNNPELLSVLRPKKYTKKDHTKIGEVFFIENHKISIGRNQAENQLLLENAKANDIWMHIKDIPSSHLIIHCGKNSPSQSILQRAAEILVGLNVNQKGNFEVDYTLRKFVKIKEKAQVNYAKYQRLCLKL